MATFKELKEKYKEIFNLELQRPTLTRWVKSGMVKAIKQSNNTYDYDLNSFIETINNPLIHAQIMATKENPKNYIGKISGNLLITGIVPKELRNNKNYTGTIMYCDCLLCGSKDNQIRFSYLTNNGNYHQMSCGCDRKKRAFLATNYQNVDYEFISKFKDFEKYLFIHRTLRSAFPITELNLNDYKKYIEYFYNQKQFNLLYDFWKSQEKRNNTFYDWAKPSLDHIIPKSKGGSNQLENLQFLTVFENLAKRDMSMDEWNNFKKQTNTYSNYFLESIKEVDKNV